MPTVALRFKSSLAMQLSAPGCTETHVHYVTQ